MNVIALATLFVLAAASPSFPGEFPRPPRQASDIAGIWEGTAWDGYHRLVIDKNGKGIFISGGVGDELHVHTIDSITFGGDRFEFSINLIPTDKYGKAISFNGLVWFGTGLLLFDPKTTQPLADPPVVSLLREAKLQKLRESSRAKTEEQ